MAEYRFLEIGAFFATPHVVNSGDSCWAAFVFFERVSDAHKTRAPGMRHKVDGIFDSPDAALLAAMSYVANCVVMGSTGL